MERKFIQDEWPKLKQAAEVHGYRGASKKKHNGIVPIRPTDKNLFKTLHKLTKDLLDPKLVPKLLPVKVVAHVPSGNRLVGYRFPDAKIVIFGLANYN